MKTQNNILRSFVLSLVVTTGTAQAGSLSIHSIPVAQSPNYHFLDDSLMSPQWGATKSAEQKYRLILQGDYEFLNDPLVRTNATHTARVEKILEGANTIFVGAGVASFGGALGTWHLGFQTGLSFVEVAPAFGSAVNTGITDSRVFWKWRLNPAVDGVEAPVGISLMPELWIPTGRDAYFLSNGWGAGIKIIGEIPLSWASIVANIGGRYSPTASAYGTSARGGVPFGIGMTVPFATCWAVNAEAAGEWGLPLSFESNPTVLYAGLRYHLPMGLTVNAGAGMGAFNGYSSQDYRITAGLTYIPQVESRPVVVATAPAPVEIISVPKQLLQEEVVEAPKVEYTPKNIRLAEEVKFKNGRGELTSAGEDLLNEVAKVIKSNRANFKKIVIEGHTNEIGSQAINLRLSKERAQAVREYLMSRGVDGEILSTVGYGKSRPKHLKGLTRAAALAANRRVEFKVQQ